jgi:hypothetical protein
MRVYIDQRVTYTETYEYEVTEEQFQEFLDIEDLDMTLEEVLDSEYYRMIFAQFVAQDTSLPVDIDQELDEAEFLDVWVQE